MGRGVGGVIRVIEGGGGGNLGDRGGGGVIKVIRQVRHWVQLARHSSHMH